MKDEALQARQRFLDNRIQAAKKLGKQLNIFGRAEYEERSKDQSENSFSPKPKNDQNSQLGLPENDEVAKAPGEDTDARK